MSMFGLMAAIFPLFSIIVFGIIMFAAVRGLSQWHKNNNSPVLTVEAVVKAKRTDTSRSDSHMAGSDNMAMNSTYHTYHYVTFEVASGDRMEFAVQGTEYGLLAEGDEGKLTFQGTRYIRFERMRVIQF